MKVRNIIFLLAFILPLGACSDWFDVSPKTDIKTEDLFSDESGFQSALTGCYVRMTGDETYGKDLTWFFLEKLVQRYDDQIQNIGGRTANIYNYTDTRYSKNYLSSIWGNMYQTIANINNLLYYLDETGEEAIKTPGYRELMKGEALALRAFHHFDLLRLFGPIYKDEPDKKCMPYRTTFSSEKQPLLSATEILEHVIADLLEAEKYLEEDPLYWGRRADEPFMAYRGHRLNKYAVKALLARVYLYRGGAEDLAEAGRLAKEVIDNCGLSLVGDNFKDVAMFDETLFGLNMYNMDERQIRTYFTSTDARNGNELWIDRSNGDQLFEGLTVGINDIRYRSGYGFRFGTTNGMMCRKYLTSSDPNYNEKIPLIRLGEVYLIAAEATGDVSYLNRLRNVRGISRTNNVGTLDVKALESEYGKEFFAEGQFFYFLKRNARETFYRCPDGLTMSASQYVLPLPDDEKEYGWIEDDETNEQ